MPKKKRRKPSVTIEVREIPTVKITGDIPMSSLFSVREWERENAAPLDGHEIYHHVMFGTRKHNDESGLAGYEKIIRDETTLIIAPRRAGKTTALAKAALELRSCGNVCIVTNNGNHFREILREVNEREYNFDDPEENCLIFRRQQIDNGEALRSMISQERMPKVALFDEIFPHELNSAMVTRFHEGVSERNTDGIFPFIHATSMKGI